MVNDLNVGDALDVVLNEEGHGVILESNGRTAGSLIGTQVAQLVNCLNSGFEYQAIVAKINGGQFIVRVEAK